MTQNQEQDHARPAMKVAYSPIESITFTPGRRSWIQYRDLGVKDATNGAMRAEVMHIDNDGASPKPTGWHYHTAVMQLLFVTEGWVKIEFPEGVKTVKEGESILIPGGTIHQELSSSDRMRLVEISVPAKMDTVPVETPDWARERAEDYGTVEPALEV